jgi:NitT/TauT family transport system substrate-binding protein
MKQANQVWRWFGILIGAVVLCGAVVHILSKGPPPPRLKERIVIAAPNHPSAGPIFVALKENFFRQDGLDVIHRPYGLGTQALQSVLDGKADIALVANTPFILATMRGEKIAIFATIYRSRHDNVLMTLTDRGITKPKDLVGKTIGAASGTSLQFFLDTMLLANDVPEQLVAVLDIRPPGLANALQSGRVDAVVVFPPYSLEMQGLLGKRAVIIFGEDIHTAPFNLIAKQDYLAKHPDTVRKVLAALNRAVDHAVNNPAQTQETVREYLNLETRRTAKMFETSEFGLTLDQSLLLALDDETRWAMKKGLVKTGPIPNYLDYLNFEPLLSVNPDAVKIIR